MEPIELNEGIDFQRNGETTLPIKPLEKLPLIALNQRAVGSTPTRPTKFFNNF